MILSPEAVDREPLDEEERTAKLAFLCAQYSQLGKAGNIEILCPCGKKVPLLLTTNCFECGLYLCAPCAARHFGKEEEKKAESFCSIEPSDNEEDTAIPEGVLQINDEFDNFLDVIGESDEDLRVAISGLRLLWATGLSDRARQVIEHVIEPAFGPYGSHATKETEN